MISESVTILRSSPVWSEDLTSCDLGSTSWRADTDDNGDEGDDADDDFRTCHHHALEPKIGIFRHRHDRELKMAILGSNAVWSQIPRQSLDPKR